MHDFDKYPVMRYVDAIPFEEEGKSYFYLHDPQEMALNPLVISPAELYILSMFDGQTDTRKIQMEFATKFNGMMLPDEHIEQLKLILDNNYYLNNPRFVKYTNQIKSDFLNSSVRKAWHAGGSYPEDSEQLKRQIKAFYEAPNGAGLPSLSEKNGVEKQTIAAIMAPHIDLRVGGDCYTHAFRPLIESGEKTDLYIILGVAHYGSETFFCACNKDFETPLGTVKTDREFIRKWSELAGIDFTQSQWTHRTEHSIEFQLPFLQYSFENNFEIVPILCASPEPIVRDGKRLEEDPEIQNALLALKKLLAEDERNIKIILSVDLAHMGPKFDQPNPITNQKLTEIKTADFKMFDVIEKMDSTAFHKLMQTDLFGRNVDACAAVYTFMQLFPNCKGKMVGYDQNFQPDSDSVVTYGSMVFYEEL